MTSALKEIVDRYDKVVGTYVQLLDDDVDLISRARAELERGVDVRRLLRDFDRGADTHAMRWMNRRDAMTEALRAQGVRVVEDGKESSDGK